nr:unnamed protein product [Callosobruchus analis]
MNALGGGARAPVPPPLGCATDCRPRERIRKEHSAYSKGSQGGTRQRIREENEEYSRSKKKSEEYGEYSRGYQRNEGERISEETEEYLRGIQRGARERIRKENDNYLRDLQRSVRERIPEDYPRANQREARELTRKETGEHSRKNRKGARDPIRKDYPRGRQRGARERICQDNERYSRGNDTGARNSVRVENEEYLRRSQNETTEQSFEGGSRGIKGLRVEAIENYSKERDERWHYEDRTRCEFDLLEKERLELRRLEEKLQTVFQEADSPNSSEKCGSESCNFEDKDAEYFEVNPEWSSQSNFWEDEQSPGPSTNRCRSLFVDKGDDGPSYDLDDYAPHWHSGQYWPEGSHQDGCLLNISEEPRNILDSSPSTQYNTNDDGLSSIYTGDSAKYPEDHLDRLQLRKIKREIFKPWRNKRWMALSEEEKAKYGIWKVVPDNGKVVVTCLNAHTRDWLFRYVPFMRPFKNAQLKTIDEELEEGECSVHSEESDRMSLATRVEGTFWKLLANNDVILRLFQIQNQGIDSSKWEVVCSRELPNGQGVELTISIDPAMAKVIEQKKFKLYCGYYQVHLRLQVCCSQLRSWITPSDRKWTSSDE